MLGGDFGGDECRDLRGGVVVEVREGLVEEEEVERLAEGAHGGDTLALAQGEGAQGLVLLAGRQQGVEHGLDVGVGLMAGEAVLDLHVLQGRELGEEAEVLKEVAEVAEAEGMRSEE